MIKTTATITQIHHSPSTDVAFVMVQPNETFSFSEGQFMMIQVDCFWKTLKRPYSIATTNKQLQESKQLWFYIKKASEYWISARITKEASVWDSIDLQGPVGHYVDSKENNQYLFISTWSGLSPNLWIFQHLVYENNEYKKIVHLFWEKTTQEIVHSVQTLLTAHWNKDTIKVITTLSRQDHEDCYSWRVQTHIDEVLQEFDSLHISVFLCWAPAMVKEVQQLLIDKGIDKENITSEKR